MKHAWLIIAHNEFEVLQRLVSMLDAPESDFYIHYDKKLKALPNITAEKGSVTILKNRLDVRWGTKSQIEVELLLLQTALKKGPYGHYHILSGTHLPLVPITALLSFYDAHRGEEIVRFWPEDPGDADFKLRRYHFPLRNFKYGHPLRQRLCQLIWRSVIRIQKILGIRHHKDSIFYKTDQWLSLTEKAGRYLVENKTSILKKYRFSFCGDEYFVVSELRDSSNDFVIFNCPHLLYVLFRNASPESFTLDQHQELKKSGFLWARKFTANHADRLD